jgi:hypothetical protein
LAFAGALRVFRVGDFKRRVNRRVVSVPYEQCIRVIIPATEQMTALLAEHFAVNS